MIVHGWARDRPGEVEARVLAIATHLVHEGHGSLLFDLRGAGRGQGHRLPPGRGLAERGVDLLGCSTGAATVMPLASTEPLVQAVAEDSGYADLGDVLADQVPKQSGLPDAFAPGTIFMAGLLVGADSYGVGPIDGMPALRARGPLLLVIHGAADGFVRPSAGPPPFEGQERLSR